MGRASGRRPSSISISTARRHPGLRAPFLWMPIAVPSRLALAEERWFPLSAVPPARVHVTSAELGGLGTAFPRGIDIGVRFGTLNHHPPHGLEDGGFGLRLAGTWRESDWGPYPYTGAATGPACDPPLDPRAPPRTLLPITADTPPPPAPA